jgi:AcrR family transcriptional regulator
MAFESAIERSPARERILGAAYELFSRDGLRAVGVDRIIDESGVARKTFYRHFPSKVDLILAFLDLRGERWTQGWLRAEANRLGTNPRECLLAMFELLDEWFHRRDFESCSFIATLFENRDPADRVHRAAVHQSEEVRRVVLDLAREAGTVDAESLASELHMLLMGAIVSATRQDLDAARRARGVAKLILDHHQLR